LDKKNGKIIRKACRRVMKIASEKGRIGRRRTRTYYCGGSVNVEEEELLWIVGHAHGSRILRDGL
jgi:hypothetical protein